MKRTAVFLILPAVVFLSSFFVINGHSDSFYLRVSSGKKSSLIVGTSKAAQTIRPDIINRSLSKRYPNLDIYNYSFALSYSPYGQTYYNAIISKLDIDSEKDNVFIVSIDPWSISCKQNSGAFQEENSPLHGLFSYNFRPNFHYLWKKYNLKTVNLAFNTIFNQDSSKYLHNNGWLEVSVPMDSMSIAKRTQKKIGLFKNVNSVKYKFSGSRFYYFLKVITLFKKYGDVYIVRLPVSCEMLAIEDELMPKFDLLISFVSKKVDCEYINLKEDCDKYLYTDGNHIHKSCSENVNQKIIGELLK